MIKENLSPKKEEFALKFASEVIEVLQKNYLVLKENEMSEKDWKDMVTAFFQVMSAVPDFSNQNLESIRQALKIKN